MYVVDIADELWRDLSQPTDLSIAAISFWLRSNVGKLNNAIGTEYSVNSSLEIAQDGELIGINEAAILKQLYLLSYYDKKIRESLGAASVDNILEVSSDGATVRKLNRNDTAKIYRDARRDAAEELNGMIKDYSFNTILPDAINGEDNIESDWYPTYPGTRVYNG